jgi:short subunit dehydrogenase-like uncharacterized protein
MTARADRPFDVVLFGATGYTGKLVAERFAHHAANGQHPSRPPLRWALAGRDRAKLEAIRAEIAAQVPSAKDVAIRVGDATDAAAMRQIASETKVICTTVGPYLKYGAEVVAACVAEGTDYCDLTGESPFIRKMIDQHHEQAQKTGAHIVHCCGFDSIPSDLGVLYLQQEMLRRHGQPANRVVSLVTMKGGASGGTIASMLEIFEQAGKDKSVRRVLGNPYGLDPDPTRRGPDGSDQKGFGYEKSVGAMTMPFVMAAINTRIVRRSHALLGYPYGDDFQYREVSEVPLTRKGIGNAVSTMATLAGLGIAISVPTLRALLAKRLPPPGSGPTAEQRDRGHYTFRIVGEVAGAPDKRMIATVADRGDPGYKATSKMLSEAALCLAFDDLPSGGGVLTPASCMGMALIERLRHSGMTFAVES